MEWVENIDTSMFLADVSHNIDLSFCKHRWTTTRKIPPQIMYLGYALSTFLTLVVSPASLSLPANYSSAKNDAEKYQK